MGPGENKVPPTYREVFLDITREAFAKVGEGKKTVSGVTDSMSPLLRGGDEITWVQGSMIPRWGDLLVFFQRHGCVVHRLIWTGRGARLWTKGDNRLGFDPDPAGRPVGVVTRIQRGEESWPLQGAGARFFAWGAAGISLVGGFSARPCAWLDALLRRLFFRKREVHWTRRMGWRIQRAGQLFWFKVFFRSCHKSGSRLN